MDKYPWNAEALREWDIVGMNHYHIDGIRYLFCAMIHNQTHTCIRAEGKDEEDVFFSLRKQAINAKRFFGQPINDKPT